MHMRFLSRGFKNLQWYGMTERKPPGRVVFCFGKLRCGVEVYPRRGKSAQQLQKIPA